MFEKNRAIKLIIDPATGEIVDANPAAGESYAETLYPRTFGWAPLRALRAEGFKYIDTPKAELYRVATDTAETTNLAETRAPLASAMQKRLRDRPPKTSCEC
jgi:arylsulfatase A-like enzyme